MTVGPAIIRSNDIPVPNLFEPVQKPLFLKLFDFENNAGSQGSTCCSGSLYERSPSPALGTLQNGLLLGIGTPHYETIKAYNLKVSNCILEGEHFDIP
jgi:hypothetical protein